MNFKHLESVDKLRGGYYTPSKLADILSIWALSGKGHHVLEPGCGDGSFLRSILKVTSSKLVIPEMTIDGVEILHDEAEKTKKVAESLEELGVRVNIHETDFLEWIVSMPLSITWDVIIGNPPYIRYQYFDKTQREYAESIFNQAKVPFTKLTNAWVPFVIASILHLAPKGYLAMVLPEELLHILHAAGLRNLLQREMEQVDIVDIRELAFKDALQGVILLRAIKKARSFISLHYTQKKNVGKENAKTNAFINIQRLNNLEGLGSLSSLYKQEEFNGVNNGKWTHLFLSKEELDLLQIIDTKVGIYLFKNVANVDIGIVTGANKFFVVNRTTAEKYELLNISLPMLARSEFIKGITYTDADQKQNESEGKAVLFLRFPAISKEAMPEKMSEYIELGEKQELNSRYKCRIRTPWYIVPYIWKANIGLLKRCHKFPRVVLNELGALSTDTAYRIVMNDGYRGREKDLVFSFFNSLTLLSAELEGRHYGGGVLELVPSEIERLRIPLVNITTTQFSHLDKMVRDGESIDAILNFTDPLVLGSSSSVNLCQNDINIIRSATNRLRDRRLRTNLQYTE